MNEVKKEEVIIRLMKRSINNPIQDIIIFICKVELIKCDRHKGVTVANSILSENWGSDNILDSTGYKGCYVSIRGVEGKSAIKEALLLKIETLRRLCEAQDYIQYNDIDI